MDTAAALPNFRQPYVTRHCWLIGCTAVSWELFILLCLFASRWSVRLAVWPEECANSKFILTKCTRQRTDTCVCALGYWHQRADERQIRSWKTPGELGVSKSIECDIIPFSALIWHCWLGDRKGIRPVKNWVLVCWRWWFDWRFARFISPVITTTSISFASINTG